MATTPEGTPYVESSDLVANYPAASLSLANRVDLVGVLPFATATARGTAIPSPTDGQYSYLQDTNTTEFWNGSAWQTAGQVPGLHLVTPTSIANSGGSASASGGAVTFTGVNSISLNGVFTTTYDNYRVVVQAAGAAGFNNQLRYRTAGVDNSATSYDNAGYHGGTGAGNINFAALNHISANVASLAYRFMSMDLSNPQKTAPTYMTGNFFESNLSGTQYSLSLSAIFRSSTAFDGLSAIFSTAASGIIRVYGYQNS